MFQRRDFQWGNGTPAETMNGGEWMEGEGRGHNTNDTSRHMYAQQGRSPEFDICADFFGAFNLALIEKKQQSLFLLALQVGFRCQIFHRGRYYATSGPDSLSPSPISKVHFTAAAAIVKGKRAASFSVVQPRTFHFFPTYRLRTPLQQYPPFFCPCLSTSPSLSHPGGRSDLWHGNVISIYT